MPTKDTPPPHPRQADRPTTTVIHSYEENETVLARWLRHGMEKGPKFWALLGGVVVVAIGLAVAANLLWAGDSSTAQAWLKLTEAQTRDQQIQVASEYPKSPAAGWALLEAAGAIYNEGFELQAANRDEASPLLKRAYSIYSQVAQGAGKNDPDLARLATLGMARTLEASNDLPRAIELYEKVASTWPGTPEAKEAEQLAKALKKSQNVEFYNWLATYKPPEVTLPPLGKGILDFPLDPGVTGGMIGRPPAGGMSGPPPTGGVPAGSVPTPTTTPPSSAPELPENLFEPSLPASPETKAAPTSPSPAAPAAPKSDTPKP
ncbi:MAG TPA: tetratricopeptide repeat protein [Isosphaeraceae bacterium]|jgi:hypothetical protein|nr:tetratricopeptide repeat protein [Isosphaeraceae bacterium]